jgi:hypothetical protein
MTSSSKLRCSQARGRGSAVEARVVGDGARAASLQSKRASLLGKYDELLVDLEAELVRKAKREAPTGFHLLRSR